MAKNRAAVTLGRKGGQARSDAKTAAAQANGRKGGRPGLDWTLLGAGAIGDAHGPRMMWRATLPGGATITRMTRSTAGGRTVTVGYYVGSAYYPTLAAAMAEHASAQHVALWLDRTSEPTPHWIVSLEDGESSRTLGVFGEQARIEAEQFARLEAKRRSLRVQTA